MGGLYLTQPDRQGLELVVAYNLPGDPAGTVLRLGDAAGPGLADVQIHLYFASYAPGPVVATTNAEGYYETSFIYIPGDEMVTVWPERPGYTFDPPQAYWRHYHGFERAERNFTAIRAAPATPFPVYLPLVISR